MKTTIINDATGVDRITELGFSLELFNGAITASEVARDSCTRAHPVTYPGTSAWANAVAFVREQKSLDEWEIEEFKGVPIVVNRSSKVALAVTSGDAGTGIAQAIPKSKNKKGAATQDIVDGNGGCQFELDPNVLGWQPRVVDQSPLNVWFLLVHRDKKRREVRSELSLPLAIGEGGHVNAWKERLILPVYSLDAKVEEQSKPNDPADEIVVEVKRKK